jgi:peptidoglycan/LPS O-acetylase OafA/YrhL
LFRFIAAVAVVLFHYLYRGYSEGNMSKLNFGEIGDFFKYGYLGVDLFFIISGFVISLSIKNRSITNFWISRISRLYPMYWLAVLLTFIVTILFGAPHFFADFKQFVFNLSMFQNYIGIENIDDSYWSLFIEMKFYIFVISLYLFLNKLKKIKLDYLIYAWLLLTIIFVFFNQLYILKFANYFFILRWSSYFIAGIIFYQIYESKINLKYLVLLSITLSISLFHAVSKIEHLELFFNSKFSPLIISSLIVVFYLLMFLVSCGKLNSINSSKLTKLGLLTYPLYLIHQNIGFIIFNNLFNYVNKYVLVLLTIIFMIFVSFILNNFYEQKASNYLRFKLKLFTTQVLKKVNQ